MIRKRNILFNLGVKLLILTIIIVLIQGLNLYTYAEENNYIKEVSLNTIEDTYKKIENQNEKNKNVSLKEIEEIVSDKYIKNSNHIKKDSKDIEELFKQLDEYSKYYNKNEFKDFLDNLGSDKATVGISLDKDNEDIVITNISNYSSAYNAGIKSKDKIMSIDGISVKGKSIEEVTNMLIGKRGSKVLLSIKSASNNSIIDKRLIRSTELYNPVSSKVVEGIGYIRISKFTKYSFYSVKDHVDSMKKEKVDKVILDLRANPGGYLDQAIRISELFVPRGPIVKVNYNNKKGGVVYSSFNDKLQFKDVCVLVDEETASAAEIVAAAIQDRNVGIIIGKKTYGKGSIQEIIKLESGEGMKITVAEYFSPKMRKIDKVGIEPDIVEENIDKDNQLLRAIEILNN